MTIDRRKAGDTMAIVAVIAILIFFMFPIYWIGSIAFKVRPDIFAWPPKYFVFTPTLQNFELMLFGQRSFLPNLFNSLVIAISSTSLSLLLGSAAGYSLSRWKFKRNEDVAFYILSTRMLPPITVVIPIYLIFRVLGLIDTYVGVMLAHTIFNLPLVTWMMKSFFDDLPIEIEESARVDGCTVPQAFGLITLPLAAPGLVASGIFAFIFSWNEFLFALVLSGFRTKTIPVALIGFQSSIGTRWGEMAAGAFIALLPVLIFTLIVQRYLVRGLTAGAVKQ